MKKFFHDFKEFAIKGNMVDIAIGVIIGTAFNKVIDVMVKNVLMPPLSLMTDGINWQNRKYVLREAEKNAQGEVITTEVAMEYGRLLETLVDFFIIGLTVFLVVKAMNRLKNRADDTKDTEVKTPKNIELLDRVADLLEKQNEILAENQNPGSDPTSS
ncbi:MAG: large conductance mechanosensitive channel protein MscL [Flavobacteriales bacterium]|nr:large conductance mechanosensitive channel protein MscL [Flavobacteriales bacterium]